MLRSLYLLLAGRSAIRVRFPPRTEFAKTLNARVNEYVSAQLEGPMRRRMWLKTGLIFGWFISSYILLVFFAQAWWQAVPLAISLALSLAGIGFAIQHDANHGAYPASARWRRLLGYSLDLLGTSSYVWRFQHNIDHHTYTNVDRADADIDVGIVLRVSPTQKRRPFHRFQHLYIWVLYCLYLFQWLLWSEWRDLFRSRIGENPFPRPKGKELVGLAIAKVVSLTLWFGPIALHPIGAYLGSVLIVAMVLGATLAIVFQLAHVVEETDFPELEGDPAQSEDEWAVHQLATTLNFAPNNRLLSWYLGGLNYQVEHHLFPRICHLHYPAIAPIVQQTCEEFGVAYHQQPTFRAALASHYRWLREMGRRPTEPPVAHAA